MNKLFLIQPPRLLKKVYSRAIWRYKTTEKEIYLTFDDGPVPHLTEWILDELKKHNAKATFFCVGNNIAKFPEIFSRIKAEGHTVANHTHNHIKGFKYNVADYIKNVEMCEEYTKTGIFRPPYGKFKKSQYKAILNKGYKIVFWDVISYDYEKIEPEYCYSIVKKNIRNGSIVLFHDNIKAEANVKFALSKTLEEFSKKGFVFRSIY